MMVETGTSPGRLEENKHPTRKDGKQYTPVNNVDVKWVFPIFWLKKVETFIFSSTMLSATDEVCEKNMGRSWKWRSNVLTSRSDR
jgi:hypothetical protein